MKKNMKKLAVLSLSFLAAIGGQAGAVGQTYSGMQQIDRIAMKTDIGNGDISPDRALMDLSNYAMTQVSFPSSSFSYDTPSKEFYSGIIKYEYSFNEDDDGNQTASGNLAVTLKGLKVGETIVVHTDTPFEWNSNRASYITDKQEYSEEVEDPDDSGGTHMEYEYKFTVAKADDSAFVLYKDFDLGSNPNQFVFNFNNNRGHVWEYGKENKYTLKNGEQRDLFYSVDAKVTEASIVGGVSAKDLFGVDVPVTVKSSNYTVGAVGIYNIVLSAVDSYGQESTATLVIHVVDRTAPVIQLKSSVNIPYSSQFTEEDMKSHIAVKDNVNADTDLVYTWALPTGFTWGASFGAKGVGTHDFGLTVTDASGNKSSATIRVNVLDNIPPVISRKDGAATTTAIVYGYSKSRTLTLATLLNLFKGKDDVDGDNLAVYLKSGEFDSSIGSHSIVIACKDSAGNEATMTLNYIIQADIPPVFILSDAIIGVTADIKLDVQDLKALIATMNTSAASAFGKIRVGHRRAEMVNWGSEGKTDIVINQQDLDAYEAGFDKVGETYQIRYTYTDTKTAETGLEGTVYIRVMDAPKDGEFEDLTGWDGFVQGWKNFWKGFVEFFTVKIPKFFKEDIPDFFNRLKNWFTFHGWKTDKEIEEEKKSEQEEKTSSEVVLE